MNKELLCRNLEKRGFIPHVFPDRKAAADYLAENIRDTTVGIGGSITVEELGLYDRLRENNRVFWHWRKDEEAPLQGAAGAEVYLTSVNSISETGELVNIDGTGNRVGATIWGPKKVYFIAGQNKVEPDLHKAIDRARNVASPLNARRLNRKTPCTQGELRCHDCTSPERICRAMVILMNPPGCKSECHVVIVEEDLGY